MDKSVDNKINQLHPSKILDEMGISWNDDIEKKTSSLYKKVSSVIPDIEWPFFAPYIEAINILKKEKNATILAHNYQTPEIFHCVSDVRGDSLQLAKEATKVDSDIIIQCGVYFMAETSKILNMDKKIIIPVDVVTTIVEPIASVKQMFIDKNEAFNIKEEEND